MFFKEACTGPQMIPDRKWSQIGPQMIAGPELIPPQKVRNGADSMKSLWIDTYCLNYPRWRKDKYLRLKAAIKTSVFMYANSLSTPSHHPCHSLFLVGIICGPHRGSFPVHDHLRSNLGIICGPGSFAVLRSFTDPYRSTIFLYISHNAWPTNGTKTD